MSKFRRDFESLGTQLPYAVEDKTDGFHFIGTVHVTRRLAQNTYQAKKEGVLHSEREGTERAGGISRRLHGFFHLNDRKKRAELCLFRDRKGRPIRIKDDCLVATSPLGRPAFQKRYTQGTRGRGRHEK